MADIIIKDVQFKRGLKANLPVLRVGEPAFTNDSGNESFFIGNGTSNIEMAKQRDMDSVKGTVTSMTQYVDKNSPTLKNEIISNLLRNALIFNTTNVTYIMVGDSTRAINGAYIYDIVSKVLNGLNVTTYLSAHSGLKAQHWGNTDDTIQPGYPRAVDLIPLIPGTGSTTIVDICLGLNDATTIDSLPTYITSGINLIKASKPDILVNITSPNLSSYNSTWGSIYTKLVNDNGYGYINILENVFKTDSDRTGYFLDTTHPNEFGQKKMAEYILDKIVPNDLKLDALTYYNVPQGYLANTTDNSSIINSGFRCEIAYSSGVETGNIYLRKNADGIWYLFDQTTGNSLSKGIAMTNGFQTVLNGFVAGKTVTANIYIKDHTILDAISNGSSYYLVSNAIVPTLRNSYSLKSSIIDLSGQINNLNESYLIRRGYLSTATINDAIRASGIRLEVVYTTGTPTGNLYLRKDVTNNAWFIYESTSGNALTRMISMQNGESSASNGFVAGKTVTAKIHIDSVSVLNSVPANDSTYYPILNGVVSTFSTTKTLREHIQTIYDKLTI